MCERVKIIWAYNLGHFNMYIIFEFPRAVFKVGHLTMLIY